MELCVDCEAVTFPKRMCYLSQKDVLPFSFQTVLLLDILQSTFFVTLSGSNYCLQKVKLSLNNRYLCWLFFLIDLCQVQ